MSLSLSLRYLTLSSTPSPPDTPNHLSLFILVCHSTPSRLSVLELKKAIELFWSPKSHLHSYNWIDFNISLRVHLRARVCVSMYGFIYVD